MRRITRGDRVRYTGTTAYLRGHTGRVSYDNGWGARVEVNWDEPAPFNPRIRGHVYWSNIARTNLVHTGISHSHLSWTA